MCVVTQLYLALKKYSMVNIAYVSGKRIRTSSRVNL